MRQWFLQGDNIKYFTISNTDAHCSMHLFANWMRKNQLKVLGQFLEKEGCKAEIKTDLMFLDLAESSSD